MQLRPFWKRGYGCASLDGYSGPVSLSGTGLRRRYSAVDVGSEEQNVEDQHRVLRGLKKALGAAKLLLCTRTKAVIHRRRLDCDVVVTYDVAYKLCPARCEDTRTRHALLLKGGVRELSVRVNRGPHLAPAHL